MKQQGRVYTTIVGIFLIIAIVILAAAFQGSGYIGVGTVAQQILKNQTTAVRSAAVNNVGQSAHWLEYCTTNVTAIDIRLEGSFDGTTWVPITDDSRAFNNSGCNTIEAGGYYSQVTANLIAISGSSASVSAFYYGAISPITAAGSGVISPRSAKTLKGIEANSFSLGAAYSGSQTLTNPGSTVSLLSLFNNTSGAGTKTAYLGTLVISCSVACNFSVSNTTNSGTGCTAITGNPMNGSSTLVSALTISGGGCSVQPTTVISVLQQVTLAANTPFVVDLSGITIPPLGQGIMIRNNSGFTGTISATQFWYEQ